MKNIIITITLLLAAQLCNAQSPEKEKRRAFKIACWSGWKQEIFVPSAERGSKEMVKLDVLNMGYSKDYFVRSGSTFNLYKKTNDEEQPYAVVLQVNIPSNVEKPLVFLSLEEDKLNYRVFDISPKNFPYGSYKVVNNTPLGLRLVFGESRFDLSPKGQKLIELKSKEKDKAVHCYGAVKQSDKLKVVWENMLKNRNHKRMLMFFYVTKDEAGRTTVKCKNLVDFYIKPVKKGE